MSGGNETGPVTAPATPDAQAVAAAALVGLDRMTPVRLRALLAVWPDPCDAVAAIRTERAVDALDDPDGARRLRGDPHELVSGWSIRIDLERTERTLRARGTRVFVTGAADMISVYVRQTFVQGETPDAMRGRVSAVNTVFIGASNELGEFESGVLAAAIGAVPAVVAGGAATIAVALLWGRFFPALRARDRLLVKG